MLLVPLMALKQRSKHLTEARNIPYKKYRIQMLCTISTYNGTLTLNTLNENNDFWQLCQRSSSMTICILLTICEPI